MSLSAQQLAERVNWIGSSEARVVVGVSPYDESLLSLYQSKVHPETVEREETEAMRMGNELEPVALRLFSRSKGLSIAPVGSRRHAILDVGATPDSVVLGPANDVVAVAEAKAPGLHQLSRWGESGDPNGVPDDVLVQVHVQMSVFRVPLAYVVALLANELRVYAIPYDDKLGTAVLEQCQSFWDKHVKPRVPPSPDGSEASAKAIRGLFPRNRGRFLNVGPEVNALAHAFWDAQHDRKDAEEREERAKQAMQLLIGERDGLVGPGFKATWMAKEKGNTAWAEVARALNPSPELIAVHTKPPSRVFLCKRPKEISR